MNAQIQDSKFIQLGRLLFSVWVFLFVLALFPLTEDASGPIKVLITHGFLVAIGLLCLLDAVMFNPTPRSSGLVFALPAACFTVGLCAFPLLDTAQQGMLDALRWWLVLFIIAGLFARVYTSTGQVIRFFQVFLVASALSSVYGLLQKLGLDPLPWGLTETYEYLNLPATYGNPNLAGHVMVISILVSVGLVFYKREPLYLLFTMLSALHLYLTGMRAGWVALLAALVLLVIIAIMKRLVKDPLKVAIVTVSLLLVGGVAAVGALLFVVSERADLAPPLDSSLQLRLNGYVNAANMLVDKPLTGVGPGRYIEETPAYWTPFEKRWFALEERRNAHVHNEALEMGAEFGLGGILAYCLLFLGSLLAGVFGHVHARFGEDRRLSLWLSLIVFAIAVDGLFGFNLHAPVSAGLAFAVFGLVAGVLMRESTPKKAPLPALLLLAAVGISAWFEVQSFQAEMQYQRAQGARLYAVNMQQNPERFNYGLNEAAASLQQAIGWKPWEPRFSKLAAIVETSRANYSGAHQAWKYTLQYSPHDPHALLGILDSALNAYIQNKDSAMEQYLQSTEAQKNIEKLERLSPDWAEYHFLRGRLAEEVEEDMDKAQAYYQQALELGAKNKPVLYKLLARLAEKSENTEALRMNYQYTVKDFPEQVEVWEALKKSGFPQEHPQVWLELLHTGWLQTQETPAAFAAQAYLARELALGYVQANPLYKNLALNIVRKSLAQMPEHPLLLQTLEELGGIALPSAAASPLETPAADLSGLAIASLEGEEKAFRLAQLSEAKAQLGDTEAALKAAREAFKIMPGHNGMKLNLARRLVQDGKGKEALFHYMVLSRNMGQDDPDFAQVHAELDALKAALKRGKELPGEQ